MPEQTVKFRVKDAEGYGDFEYTAHINTIRGTMAKVSWMDNGIEEDIPYETDEVMQYFEDGTWIKI